MYMQVWSISHIFYIENIMYQFSYVLSHIYFRRLDMSQVHRTCNPQRIPDWDSSRDNYGNQEMQPMTDCPTMNLEVNPIQMNPKLTCLYRSQNDIILSVAFTCCDNLSTNIFRVVASSCDSRVHMDTVIIVP